MSKLHLPLLLGIFMATAVLVVGVRRKTMGLIVEDCKGDNDLKLANLTNHDSNEVVCFHICSMALVWAERSKSAGNLVLNYFRNERKLADCPDFRNSLE